MEGMYHLVVLVLLVIVSSPLFSLVTASYSTYGNTIKIRSKYLDSAGKRSWIDLNPDNTLPNGTLTHFHVFVHNVPMTASLVTRLQIWRPQDGSKYKLIYGKRVEFKDGGYRREIFDVQDDKVTVAQGDRIGWTYESDIGAISYDTSDTKTAFRRYSTLPVVGETYTFDSVPFPSLFSIAVVIFDAHSGVDNATIVTPKYVPAPTTTTQAPTTPTTAPQTSTDTLSTNEPSKPLPNWFPFAIIGVSVFIVLVIVVFVLLYLRDRNYRRTRYDVYDVKFHKGKGHHPRHYEYPSAEIMFPTSVGLSGYKHDLNYYLDTSNYDMKDYENFTVQLGPDGGRQVHDNAGFMAEAIIHQGDDDVVVPNNNNSTVIPNGRAHHDHSDEIEHIHHI